MAQSGWAAHPRLPHAPTPARTYRTQVRLAGLASGFAALTYLILAIVLAPTLVVVNRNGRRMHNDTRGGWWTHGW